MWTAITWLAASTSRIRIVPSVISLPYRHPAVLAKMAESLDRLSGHRLIMALGAGGDRVEFANAVAGGSDEVTAGLMEFVDMGFTQINLWTHGEHDRQRELLAENALGALRSLPFP